MNIFTLVLFTLSASLCAEAVGVRGVQERNKGMYELSSSTFRCLDGSFEVPAAQVNDEYCDCADGSDEPGTPACTFEARHSVKASWSFQCTDTSFMTKEIMHSHINDGICDCCDGSDEYSSSARCPNTCAAAHKKAEAERAEREVKRQLGLKEKTSMVEEAKSRRDNLKIEVQTQKSKVEVLTAEREAAALRKTQSELDENIERTKIKQKSEDAMEAWKAERAVKQAQIEELKKTAPQENEIVICSKWRQTKDCVGSGERAPDDDKECDAVIADGWSGYCDCFDTETNSEIRHEFDCGHKSLRCSYVCSHNGAEPESVEEMKDEEFKVDDGSSFELPEAREARDQVRTKQREIDEAERKIKEIEEDLARDFGPDDALLPLKGKCFELEQREYSCKVCPFSEVQQVRKGGSHGTNMGRWKSFGEQSYSSWGSKQDYSHMLFTDGEHCWGGPHRSTDVHVVCGPTNAVISVEEPSMCTYKMVLETPAACE